MVDGQKILFVYNPKSGRKNTDWELEIQHFMEETKVCYRILDIEHIEDLSKIISEFRPTRVIAVGGDGTVSYVAKKLEGQNIPLGILPAGSANGMARELGIPNDPEQALRIALHAVPKKIDAVLLNDCLSLHLSDLGMNARLIKYFEDGRLRGMFGYAISIIRTLQKSQRLNVTIETPQKQINRNTVMVAIANATKYGTGAIINHIGALDDGLFEVIIVRRLGIREMIKALFRNRRRFNPKRIEIFSARRVKIRTRQPVHFQTDGEYHGKVREIEAKVLPGFIEMIFES